LRAKEKNREKETWIERERGVERKRESETDIDRRDIKRYRYGKKGRQEESGRERLRYVHIHVGARNGLFGFVDMNCHYATQN